MNNNTIGGVSPLKARQSSRGGKYAGKATSTAGRRGGFAKSTGSRGGGGRNVGGYNAQTRFSADKWTKPGSGGTITPTKPYAIKDGKVIMNPDATADATATATSTSRTGHYEDIYGYKDLNSYKHAWKTDQDGVQGKYSTFEEYQADAIKWWEDSAAKAGMSVEEFKKKYKEKQKIGEKWVWDDPVTTTSTSTSSAHATTKKK